MSLIFNYFLRQMAKKKSPKKTTAVVFHKPMKKKRYNLDKPKTQAPKPKLNTSAIPTNVPVHYTPMNTTRYNLDKPKTQAPKPKLNTSAIPMSRLSDNGISNLFKSAKDLTTIKTVVTFDDSVKTTLYFVGTSLALGMVGNALLRRNKQ